MNVSDTQIRMKKLNKWKRYLNLLLTVVNSPLLIAIIKNNKVTIMKISEIQEFINKLDGHELSVLNFYAWKRLDKEIIRYYNKYKKCDGDIIELPRHLRSKENQYFCYAATTGKKTNNIELKGFKVNTYGCGNDICEILSIYTDDTALEMSILRKGEIVEYFYEIEKVEIARAKAEKGCDFNNEDIIITDPSYIFDYDKTDGYTDFKKVGIDNIVCHDTIYGDWSCTTFDTNTNKPLGDFCADAGLVCVAPLKKVIELNDGYETIKDNEWTRTIIHNFTGHVYLDFKKDEDGFEDVEVVGEGNINFRTKQTEA